MKKIVFLICSILCMIAFSSMAFSEETKDKINMFAGKVVTIDLEHKTFTMKEDNRGLFTCTFGDSTPVRKNNQQKAVSDIKVGDIIVVIYEKMAGKNLAKTITVFVPAQGSP